MARDDTHKSILARMGTWIRTRRGGSFIVAFAVFMAFGSFATVTALLIAIASGSQRLADAGEFASGVAALFGLTAIALALLANYITSNRDSVNAEEAWTKKLRLEETSVFAFALVRRATEYYLKDTGDESLAEVGRTPLVRYARHMLKEALEDARKSGLHRVLSLISSAKGEEDLGDLLTHAEAILVEDLASNNPSISGAMSVILAETSLLDQLQAVTFDEVASYWNRPWNALKEVRRVAGRVALAASGRRSSGSKDDAAVDQEEVSASVDDASK